MWQRTSPAPPARGGGCGRGWPGGSRLSVFRPCLCPFPHGERTLLGQIEFRALGREPVPCAPREGFGQRSLDGLAEVRVLAGVDQRV